MNSNAFEIVSAATCIRAFEQQHKNERGGALLITEPTWQRFYANTTKAATSPWWMDVQNDHDSATAHLWVPEDLPCFAGHFPNHPILPGVVQLDWAIALADELWPEETPAERFAGSARLKFKAPIAPDSMLKLTLKRSSPTANSQQSGIAFALYSATQALTNAKLMYRD